MRNFTSYLEIARSLYLKKGVIRIVTSVRQREKSMLPMRYRTPSNNRGGTGWRVRGLEPPTPPPLGLSCYLSDTDILTTTGWHFTTQLIFYYKKGGEGKGGIGRLELRSNFGVPIKDS